jgi:hypothetical protein
MSVCVDKAGCQRQSVGIDIAVCLVNAQVADRDDPVASDGHIGFKSRTSRAIEHNGIPDDQIAAQLHELVPFIGFVGDREVNRNVASWPWLILPFRSLDQRHSAALAASGVI